MYFWWMILGFQAVWFSCAWGISHHYPLLPLIVSLVYLNSYISKQSPKKPAYLFLLRILLYGFLLDSALGLLGFIVFESAYPMPFEWLQPWWLSLLWLSFAASAKASFFWLEKRLPLAVLLGAIAGPTAYFSGEKFGVFISINILGYALLSIGYGMILYLIMQAIEEQQTPIQ